MTRVSFVSAILFASLFLTLTTQAQTGVTGTWRVDGVGSTFPWEAVFKIDGPRLIGAVSSCASVRAAFEIFEGTFDGNTIAFKCTSGDGQRTIAFTGTIRGDEITFAWEKQVREGGNPAAGDGLFGTSAPPRFTAKRAPNATDAVSEMADNVKKIPRVSFDRILHADHEPQNWLTYSGTLLGQRYSPLTQITSTNVQNLELAWIWQAQSQTNFENFEATALVADGTLYTVQAPNDVVALDAATGRVLWTYPYAPKGFNTCCGRVNRGLAILGDTLFMGTLDAHLLAINAYSGKLIWDTTVANAADPGCREGRPVGLLPVICYSITHAPLVVKGKVIVGTAGGEGAIRGFIAAFDAATGKEVWRFNTIPASGEPGSETWSGDSWKTGGAGVWNTGSYDPDLNLTYWGTGNPHGNTRLGDNLYSDSVVALDADTGKLKWYYQFTPHDVSDWDASQVPVLAEIEWQGRARKVMLQATENGLMYVLDRTTGQFLMGKPFVEVNWMEGFDEKGRPLLVPGKIGSSEKTLILPGAGTNWFPPSYSPGTRLFYVSSWERGTVGGYMQLGTPGYGAMRAFDPQTGEKKWEFKRNDAVFTAGALTTGSDLLFTGVTGDRWSVEAAARVLNGNFYALDALTGQLLWQRSLPGSVQGGPMSYSVGGTQYVAVAAGNTLFSFALKQ